MSDNPYRFTVTPTNGVRTHWVDVWLDYDGAASLRHLCDFGPFPTEAEANEHAELIRQAMREVS